TQGQEQNAPAEDQTVENTSDASERLNERQQVIVSQYSDVEKEVAALLESNVWAAGSSSATLRFGENTYTESREGSPDVIKTYVITACKLESSSIDEHGEYTTTYTFAIDTGDKEYIVALSQLHPASEEVEQPWSLTSEVFSYAATYSRIGEAIDLNLERIDDKFTDLVGGEEVTESMHSLIKGYCSMYYPSVTTATWDQKASLDYGQNTAVFTFQLNNSAKTNLKVLHVLGTDAFEIGQ
ncbi:MAG: hypothetical protein RR505_08335, partial [Raoultibacter sp.]